MKGKYIVLVILFLLFIPSVHAGNWDSYNHDLYNTSSTEDNGPEPPLKVNAKYDIGDDWLTPIVHNNIVYIVRNGWDGTRLTIIALNLTNQKILWMYHNSSYLSTYAFYHNGNIYIDDNDGAILAINATTGHITWIVETGKYLSNNVVYENGKLYFLEEGIKNKTTLVVVNSENGKVIEKKLIANIGLAESTYLIIKNGILYAYYGGVFIGKIATANYFTGILYAVNIKNGSMLWNYTVKNWNECRQTYLSMTPFTMGEGNIYIPVIFNNCSAGVQAVNASTGKLEWTKITEPFFDHFTYHFAYSPDHHMIVRSGFVKTGVDNYSLYLFAFDSRDGHTLWTRNITQSKDGWDPFFPSIVIANNYIYMYNKAVKNFYSQDTRAGWQLRLYSIENGSLVYYVNLRTDYGVPGGQELDAPQIAVVNGTVIVPEGSLYIIVHDNSKPPTQNGAVAYVGISAAVIGAIVASVIIVRKRNGKTHEDTLK